MESSNRPVDPLSRANQNKEKKKAEEKGKHKSVRLSTINRGPTQGSGGMSFSDTEGQEPEKVVKRKKSGGFSFTGFFKNGAVGVGSVPQPNENTGNESSTDEE
ncbi:MAG: hypothetical protein WA152_00240 [Microgenomates group bacterium]